MEIYRYKIVSMDMTNAGIVSSKIKKILQAKGTDKKIIRRVAIASYEAEINVVIHSYGGICIMKIDEDKLVLEFTDIGPGIPSIEKAMQRGWSTASKLDHENGFGAGMGFPNMKDASDELVVTSSEDGTVVKLFFNLR